MRIAAFAVLALILACPSPEQEREALTARRVAEVLELYHAWDRPLAVEVFGESRFIDEIWEGHLGWLHDQLGRCGPAAEVEARGRRSDGRFRSACERGALEIELWLRDGVARSARVGGRGIAAAPHVRAAADAVVAAMPLDDAALDRLPAGEDFINDFARGLGRCAVAGDDIVGQHGALFFLECDGGPAYMKIDVDPAGEPRRLWLLPAPDERFRFVGPHGV
jgi:hypothetical protein